MLLQLRLLPLIILLSESIAMPIRYAQHPALLARLVVMHLAFGSSLQVFLLTRMFHHVDGYSYLLLIF
jgi:hypothetical protein